MTTSPTLHASFRGRIVLLGFGSIGQAVLPLLLRHIDMSPQQIEILKPTADGLDAAREYGVPHVEAKLTRDNYREVLEPRLHAGDFLLNLSVDVSSKALIELCHERQCLYLDSSTEPWPGGFDDRKVPADRRTNYRLREDVLALRKPGQPTTLITLGANPGLVSFLLKRALLDLAGPQALQPAEREGWARLAQRLGVRVIHVAEHDTQVGNAPKGAGEFVNTWSIDGFIGEGLQPAELGWGTHERHFPPDGGRHEQGCRAAIYLQRPGMGTRVRSWTPLGGPYEAFLVTHAESISIADHLTVGDPGQPAYRPTVHYAYHPCGDAVLSVHEMAGRQWQKQEGKRLLRDDILAGRDELGVLLMGHAKGAYWYGSQLTVEEARQLCPYNNATSLQVAAPIMAGMAWAMKHPLEGILEPDDLPHDEMLAMVLPYLGTVVGAYSGWTPLSDREKLFDESLDRDDPWQFKNFRVD
jgi:homospermidine synthase